MTDPRSFGAWLRRERERRSITVRAIADRTKVGAGLLEGLERGDVSRWPGGIYRRAFVRAYAESVGLDADLVVANFERVFPSDPSAARPCVAAGPSTAERQEMRLALVTPSLPGLTRSAAWTAGRDITCVAAVAAVGFAVAGGVGFWCAAAITALAFHLTHVIGLQQGAFWRRLAERWHSADSAPAEVVSFSVEHRRSRARRVLADLSAAASSAAFPGRRRPARS